MLERTFKVKFGFEEILHMVHVVEKHGHDYPLLDVQCRKPLVLGFQGELENSAPLYHHVHPVKSNWSSPKYHTHKNCYCKSSFEFFCTATLFTCFTRTVNLPCSWRCQRSQPKFSRGDCVLERLNFFLVVLEPKWRNYEGLKSTCKGSLPTNPTAMIASSGVAPCDSCCPSLP